MGAIRDTYKRARAEWERGKVYGTELSMVLNHKYVGIGTENRMKNLVSYTQSYGKNIMDEYWIIGGVKIWGII